MTVKKTTSATSSVVSLTSGAGGTAVDLTAQLGGPIGPNVVNGFNTTKTILNSDPWARNCDGQHVLDEESELVDGRIQGKCTFCGDSITGRRLPGGLGLLRLKAALVEAIGDEGALPALVDELDRVELLLKLEEQTIEDGRRLIETARQMLLELLDKG